MSFLIEFYKIWIFTIFIISFISIFDNLRKKKIKEYIIMYKEKKIKNIDYGNYIDFFIIIIINLNNIEKKIIFIFFLYFYIIISPILIPIILVKIIFLTTKLILKKNIIFDLKKWEESWNYLLKIDKKKTNKIILILFKFINQSIYIYWFLIIYKIINKNKEKINWGDFKKKLSIKILTGIPYIIYSASLKSTIFFIEYKKNINLKKKVLKIKIKIIIKNLFIFFIWLIFYNIINPYTLCNDWKIVKENWKIKKNGLMSKINQLIIICRFKHELLINNKKIIVYHNGVYYTEDKVCQWYTKNKEINDNEVIENKWGEFKDIKDGKIKMQWVLMKKCEYAYKLSWSENFILNQKLNKEINMRACLIKLNLLKIINYNKEILNKNDINKIEEIIKEKDSFEIVKKCNESENFIIKSINNKIIDKIKDDNNETFL